MQLQLGVELHQMDHQMALPPFHHHLEFQIDNRYQKQVLQLEACKMALPPFHHLELQIDNCYRKQALQQMYVYLRDNIILTQLPDAGDGRPLAEASAPAGHLQDGAPPIPPSGVPDRQLLSEMGAPAEDAGDGHPLAEASAPAGRLQDHASTIPPPGVPDAGDRRLLAEMSPLTDGHLQDDAIHPGPDVHPELHMQETDAYGQPFLPTTPFQHPYPSS
ncbi:hypothetical protein BDR03DRAFT_1007693 [Suillus americanus]|nr:hypothetical protein BDR03DRAFT_1007693 [Suillus americanus]